MTGIVCSVHKCRSNSVKVKKEGKHLNFFNYPRDPNIKKQWISKCIRIPNWDPTNKRVCSKHFLPEDFEDNIKAKILGVPPKRLKRDAIPSLYLPDIENIDERQLNAEDIMEIEWIDEDFNYATSEIDIEQFPTEENIDSQTGNEIDIDILKERIQVLEKENNHLKKFRERALHLERREMKLQDKITELEQSLSLMNDSFESKAKYIFRDLLTPKQVEVILKKKSKSRWTIDDFSRAFTLRYMSRKAYIYLRRYLHYPLPGISTLEKWVTCMKHRGIWEDVMHLIKTKASRRVFQRNCD